MFDKALLKLQGMGGMLGMLVVFAFVQGALVIGQTLALAHAISQLWAGAELASQAMPIAVFVACFACRRLVQAIQDELLDRYATRTASDLRGKLLQAAFSDEAGLASDLGTAAIAVAATNGVDDVARYIRVIPPKICGIVGIAIPVLVALFVIDWVSGIIALVTFPVIMLFMIMLGKQARAQAERQFQAYTRLSNHFLDALRGIDSLKALGAHERESQSVYSTSEQLRAATLRTLSVATLSSAMLDLITVFGVAAVAMMLAFRLMDGSMGLEGALAALMLAPEFFTPIRLFASDFHASLDGKNALADVLRIVERPSVAAPEDKAVPAWGPDSELRAEGLSYVYGDSPTQAVHDITFTLSGFQKVAVVGASGAGKSTLANMLAGLTAPSGGTLSVDETSVSSLCSPSWRNQVHYVTQHPHVFDATLEDNIRFYRPEATRDEVERVVELVGLDELVEQLPQGLDTTVGTGGRGLSGGQAHRVACARILLDDRKVVLFDEPTAHLDIQTELELKRSMLACMDGRLVVLCTHRLHWLADMDQVIVMQDGTVVQAGPPARLLAEPGPLRDFVDAQRGEAVA